MPISLVCDACDKPLRIDDHLACKRIRCPKCQAVVSVPTEDERPAAPKRRPERDEDEADRPRKKTTRAADPDEDRLSPRRRSAKMDPKKGGGLVLWLGLGGGVLLLGLAVGAAALFYRPGDGSPRAANSGDSASLRDGNAPKDGNSTEDGNAPKESNQPRDAKAPGKDGNSTKDGNAPKDGNSTKDGNQPKDTKAPGKDGKLPDGGTPRGGDLRGGSSQTNSISAEMKYFPDNPQHVTSRRTDQIRKTRFAQKHWKSPDGARVAFGLKAEQVERVTSAGAAGGEYVVIITSKDPVTADEIKVGLTAMRGKSDLHYTEEKVGDHVLYVPKDVRSPFAFCIPEGGILLTGGADPLRKILRRDKAPAFSPAFEQVWSLADFSISDVWVSTKKGSGRPVIGIGTASPNGHEATYGHVNYGPEMAWELTLVYEDAAAAEAAHKELQAKRPVDDGRREELQAQTIRNAKVGVSGSSLTLSTSASEQAYMDARIRE